MSNVRTPSIARLKARGRLYIHDDSMIELCCYLLGLRRYKRKSVEVGFFFEGGHFERKFQMEDGVPTDHCWCQKSSVISLSCGIKISAVHHLILSQSTRVTNGQTDRITTPKTALA